MRISTTTKASLSEIYVPVVINETVNPECVDKRYATIKADSQKYFFKTVRTDNARGACRINTQYAAAIIDSKDEEINFDFVDDITCYKILISINKHKAAPKPRDDLSTEPSDDHPGTEPVIESTTSEFDEKCTIEAFNDFKKTLIGNIYNFGVIYSNEYFSWKIISTGGLVTKETVIVIDNMMNYLHVDLHETMKYSKQTFKPHVDRKTVDLVSTASYLVKKLIREKDSSY